MAHYHLALNLEKDKLEFRQYSCFLLEQIYLQCRFENTHIISELKLILLCIIATKILKNEHYLHIL